MELFGKSIAELVFLWFISGIASAGFLTLRLTDEIWFKRISFRRKAIIFAVGFITGPLYSAFTVVRIIVLIAFSMVTMTIKWVRETISELSIKKRIFLRGMKMNAFRQFLVAVGVIVLIMAFALVVLVQL